MPDQPQAPAQGPEPTDTGAAAPTRGPRLVLPRTLVAVGAVLGILAILAVWISRQALETDQWVDTSSALLEEPAVQTAVSGFLVDQLYANVDVAGELRAALPDRADALAGPAAGALRQGAEQVADRALDRPRVQAAWEDANRAAHATLVKVVEGGGPNLSTDQGVVTLHLRSLLEQIAERTGVGGRVVDRIPPDAADIVVLRSDQLGTIQSIAKALKPLAAFLVLGMIACFGAAIALARGRRREMVRAAGFGLIFAGAAALAVRQLAGTAVVDEVATTEAVKPAIESAWSIGTSLLVGVAVATMAYGALAVAGAWLAGPMGVAVRARRWLAPYLRDARITYGAVAALVLLVLIWGPTEGTRRPLPALILVLLLLAGVEALRRQVAGEFPDATRGAPGAAVAGAAGALVRRARPAGAGDMTADTAPTFVPGDGADSTTVRRNP